MEFEASNAQTMDSNAINLIWARLEPISQDVARLKIKKDLEKSRNLPMAFKKRVFPRFRGTGSRVSYTVQSQSAAIAVASVASRRDFINWVDDQPPQPVDLENENVSHVEFRVAFQALAQAVTYVGSQSGSHPAPVFKHFRSERASGSKAHSSTSGVRAHPCCGECGKCHQGMRRAGSDVCFGSGELGHRMRECRVLTQRGKLHALQVHLDWEGFPEIDLDSVQLCSVKNSDRVFQLGVETSTERGKGWRLLPPARDRLESLVATPDLQNCVANVGCRSHRYQEYVTSRERVFDYYITLGQVPGKGHLLERIDQREIFTRGTVQRRRIQNFLSSSVLVSSSSRSKERGRQGDLGREIKSGYQTRKLGLNSIKVSLPIFKGESDPKEYLAWMSSFDRLFQVNDLMKEKNSCYAIAHFEGELSASTPKNHQRPYSKWHQHQEHSSNANQNENKVLQTETKAAQRYPPRNEGKIVLLGEEEGLELNKGHEETQDGELEAGVKIDEGGEDILLVDGECTMLVYKAMIIMLNEGVEEEAATEEGEEEEKLRFRIVAFAQKDPLLHTKKDASTLHSLLSSYVQEEMKKKGSRIAKWEIAYSALAISHKNLRKSPEKMLKKENTSEKFLNKMWREVKGITKLLKAKECLPSSRSESDNGAPAERFVADDGGDDARYTRDDEADLGRTFYSYLVSS
ncbi:hypothetical protein FXO38_23646 [Capsicum annuum]|nr:hypothetical protein FXO38_23646 [Capsicum annuum]